MDSLAGANGRAFTRLVHLQDLIGEDTGSIDHATGSYLINRTGLLISNRNAGYFAVAILQKPYDFRIVQDTSASVDRAADHINRKAGIIELAVVINDTALQSALDGHRQTTGRLRGRNET